MYNLDPHGTQMLNGIKVPVILCHQDSYKLGLGGNHADIYHWFTRYGKDMDDVRNDVAKLMGKPVSASPTISAPNVSGTTTVSSFKVGDAVKLVAGAKYTSGVSVPAWLYNTTLYIRQLNGDDAVVSTLKTGAITGIINLKYLTKTNQNKLFVPYKVKVTANNLNIRSGASISYKIVGSIKNKGVYTIVDEVVTGSVRWGLLKAYSDKRNGWINLSYTKKL